MVQDTCTQVRDTASLFLLEQVIALRHNSMLVSYYVVTLWNLAALLNLHNVFQQFIQVNSLWKP